MKIGVIGDDARTAAIVKAISKEKNQIFAVGAKINPQIARIAQWNVAYTDPQEIAELLKTWGAEMVVIGPEKPLAQGIVDILEKAGIAVAAPSSVAAQIELDKAWMVELLKKYDMAKWLPRSKIFRGNKDVGLVSKLIDHWEDVAVKPAGLTGGKGVKVTGDQLPNKSAAKKYARELLLSGQTIVIQRKLFGCEFSLQAFVDRYGFMIFTPLVMDYKKLYDGDVVPNPNTGSMGSVNNANGLLSFVSEAVSEQAQSIMKKIVLAIEEETGELYKGPIYGQFMLTEEGRLAVIEMNARLGDPEAINILSLLTPETNFTKICQGIVNGNLSEVKVAFKKKAVVVKYVVPSGYPGDTLPVVVNLEKTNLPIEILFGGIKEDDSGNLVTTGSRAIAVAAEAETIPEAAKIVNQAIPEIFVNCINQLHWRPGIGLEL